MTTQEQLDSEGFLVNPNDWSEELAVELAKDAGIELDERYWPILRIMRNYYAEHQVAPDVRHVFKELAGELSIDKRSAKKILFDLFPYGYVEQACKIAGMKRPRAWSTG